MLLSTFLSRLVVVTNHCSDAVFDYRKEDTGIIVFERLRTCNFEGLTQRKLHQMLTPVLSAKYTCRYTLLPNKESSYVSAQHLAA